MWNDRPALIVRPGVASDPNPFAVAVSIVRSLIRVDRPVPTGSGVVDHAGFEAPLAALAAGGTPALADIDGSLRDYIGEIAQVQPNRLGPHEAKAYWLNLYNAGALRLAARALAAGQDSVLRMPGAFRDPFVEVAKEALSLDDIEHAKVRRFGDPRVHGALVCGSVSCPTLRLEPYSGTDLDGQLDRQMRSFLSNGGAMLGDGAIRLSRIFSWFGSDFVRPHRMPTFIPSRSSSVLQAIRPWLPEEMVELSLSGLAVRYQTYDWGLRCAVA